jgi:hypothetical protein
MSVLTDQFCIVCRLVEHSVPANLVHCKSFGASGGLTEVTEPLSSTMNSIRIFRLPLVC